jgi:hypothetical protein
MSNYGGYSPAFSDDSLIPALEQLDLPLDSHVTVARRAPNRVMLRDVYRLVKGQPLIVTLPRDWNLTDTFPVGPRRDNYRGIVFPSATVASITIITLIIVFEKANN